MTTQVLVVDNYDSFTFNLVQAFGALGSTVNVVRCDSVDPDNLKASPPDALVISPGPGRPEDAGSSLALVRALSGRIPILGVCLGHQAIGAAFGGNVVNAPSVVHGKTSQVFHEGGELFADVPSPFEATRYHSLVIDEQSIASTPLRITARSGDGLLMAIEHSDQPTFGVQFHPESVLTTQGSRILENFLGMAGKRR